MFRELFILCTLCSRYHSEGWESNFTFASPPLKVCMFVLQSAHLCNRINSLLCPVSFLRVLFRNWLVPVGIVFSSQFPSKLELRTEYFKLGQCTSASDAEGLISYYSAISSYFASIDR